MKRYAESVGKLVVNFGRIEYLSYLWISSLQEDTALIEVAVDMQLSQRIVLVKKLVVRKLREPQKKKAAKLWERVRDLSELRNVVCHNPYMFGWTSGVPEGDPDFAATPLIKQTLRGKKGRAMPKFDEILAGVEETESVGNELLGVLIEYVESLIGKKQTA